MNAARLLAHYERIAHAPDAIARLRRFILDLAVRGRLVEQKPNDEPASELLKRIDKEKARLLTAGEIKLRSISARDRDVPIPFDCPIGWVLTELGEIALSRKFPRLNQRTLAAFLNRIMRFADFWSRRM